MNISGGTLNFTYGELGAKGSATFVIQGSNPKSIQGNNLDLLNHATLTFKLDAKGAVPLEIKNKFNPSKAAKLVIDGSGYTGRAQTIALVKFAQLTQPFDTSNVSITGFKGKSAKIKYTVTTMNLVISGSGKSGNK